MISELLDIDLRTLTQLSAQLLTWYTAHTWVWKRGIFTRL